MGAIAAAKPRPLYVAVEGPIGVGKSTLVHRLSERMGARLVMEVVEENPFLPRFYEDRERFAFQTQLFFLMSRFRQQEELHQADLFLPNTLADYHLLKDRIFAQLTLRHDELALYERVYRSLETQILQPDVLIYLSAPHDVLIDRIRRRGRTFELDFDPGYLRSVSEAYQHYFAHYRGTPLLALDNTNLDYVTQSEPVEEIYAQVMQLAGRGQVAVSAV
ncbi:MAG: deoxynucleoside kinase [Myxococcales bacterium]|nr:deoxynucleoside kinase [Myxococcales bacterium]